MDVAAGGPEDAALHSSAKPHSSRYEANRIRAQQSIGYYCRATGGTRAMAAENCQLRGGSRDSLAGDACVDTKPRSAAGGKEKRYTRELS